MSEGQMPELTAAEVRVLEELAEMSESDPEGYEAVMQDIASDADPERDHAEWLLKRLTAGSSDEAGGQFAELLNAAWRSQGDLQAEESSQQ